MLAHGKHALLVLKDERRDLYRDAQGLCALTLPQNGRYRRRDCRWWDVTDLRSWPQVQAPLRVVRSQETEVVHRQDDREMETQNSDWIWLTSLRMRNCWHGRGNLGERLANVLTHGLGLILSIVGAAALMTTAIRYGSARHIVATAIFSFGLVLLYSASTLYHAIQASHLKRVLRSLDHSAIFVLIAGTYTPFTLVTLRGGWGWWLFGVIWGLALGGVILKIFLVGRFPAFSTGLYVLMGWVAIIALKPLLAAVSLHGLLWLLAGGLFYTGGVLFYLAKKMPYSHAVWHLFVLGGSACHYGAVMFYVLPRPPA